MKLAKTLTGLLAASIIIATPLNESAKERVSLPQDAIIYELQERRYGKKENNFKINEIKRENEEYRPHLRLSGRNVDMNRLVGAITQYESGGDSMAISNRGAWGKMQLRAIVLKEYKRENPGDYVFFSDLYNPEINEKIGRWYINRIAKEYLPNLNLPVNVDNLITAYHRGLKWFEEYGDATDNPNLPGNTRHYIKTIKKALANSQKII